MSVTETQQCSCVDNFLQSKKVDFFASCEYIAVFVMIVQPPCEASDKTSRVVVAAAPEFVLVPHSKLPTPGIFVRLYTDDYLHFRPWFCHLAQYCVQCSKN